jgi:hypothetical protein
MDERQRFRNALAGATVSTEPATEADIDKAVNRIVTLMRRRYVAEPGDEAELREYARKWLSEHPDASYIRLYSAVMEYVKDNIYAGPLVDHWGGIRPTDAKALKPAKAGYGYRA